MKLRYTVPATRDLERILDYLAQQSPRGARHVQERIQATTGLILQQPYAGRPTRRPGIRRIVVSPYPYLIFYRVTEDVIIVHAVRHAARRPGSMPGHP